MTSANSSLGVSRESNPLPQLLKPLVNHSATSAVNERLKRIKEENINVIKEKIHLDVEASITNMIMNPNKEWLARKKTHHLT
jgi:hypothetical protein